MAMGMGVIVGGGGGGVGLAVRDRTWLLAGIVRKRIRVWDLGGMGMVGYGLSQANIVNRLVIRTAAVLRGSVIIGLRLHKWAMVKIIIILNNNFRTKKDRKMQISKTKLKDIIINLELKQGLKHRF